MSNLIWYIDDVGKYWWNTVLYWWFTMIWFYESVSLQQIVLHQWGQRDAEAEGSVMDLF